MINNSKRWAREAGLRAFRSTSILILFSLVTTGCLGTPAMLEPASENTTRIANLTWSIATIAAFVFVIVEALLLYTAFRYRRRSGAGLPKQIHGNLALEIIWTSFPAIVLAIVFALTLGTLLSISNSPAASESGGQPTKVLNVRVIGHQWWWEYQYTDLGITTANEMHIPVGSTVNLQVESVDVIHSFWVPQLGNKIDGIPGLLNHTVYRATKTGQYKGQCSEFCGAEHALMRMDVVVEPADQFLAWVANEQAPAAPVTGAAAQGRDAFLASPCINCHTIRGTEANGKLGPELTHFGSRATFAGAAFDNNPENLTAWLHDPQAMKPGNLMPNLGMTSGAVQSIVTYLESLK